MTRCQEVFRKLPSLSLIGLALVILSCSLPQKALALLDYEEDLNLEADWNKNHVEEDECLQAWPVDCAEGSGGNSTCGGWRKLADLAESETWPGDNQATCSTGLRLTLGNAQTQGQAVGAMFPGTVLFAQSGRSRDGRDYGGVVVVKLDLDDGSPQCFLRYMFLDRRDMVRVGTKVKAGQRIGSVASDDMSPTKRWWQENWGDTFPPQVKIDMGCDEALVNLPHFMPKEPYTGGGPDDIHSCPLTKFRFPTPLLTYLKNTEHGDNKDCKVGIRVDARKFKAAPPQDDTEKLTKMNMYWTSSVRPRGVIRHKETPVYALFKNDTAQRNLYGANPNAENQTPIMRQLESYRTATTYDCENMGEIFKGKDGVALAPKQVRELLTHCTNQYILGRSMNPTVQDSQASSRMKMDELLTERKLNYLDEDVQTRYRTLVEQNKTNQEIYNEMQDEVAKVFFRDHCQPLAMQDVQFKDYAPHLVLTKAWNELLIDWPEEQKLNAIDRVSFDPIDINMYTQGPYEKIIDPSHPFSPRHIFAETERERYSNYGVQCAASPVDIILGTYGKTKDTQRTYGRRDDLFHQCISCRIEINERKDAACFADPYSFQTLGGCPNNFAQGGTVCDNLPTEFNEPLNNLSMEFGMRREFLEFILKRESSCASLGAGKCLIGADGHGIGFWQIDDRWHDVSRQNDTTAIFGSSALAQRVGVVGKNACDFYEGGRYGVALLAENTKNYDCNPVLTAASYNGGAGAANAVRKALENAGGDWNAVINNLDNIPNLYWPTPDYIRNVLQYFAPDESICLDGGPFVKGDGAGAGGIGNNNGGGGDFQWGNVFGSGNSAGGNQQAGGTHVAPSGEKFRRTTGIDIVRTGLQRFRGRPYSMTGPRLDPDGATTDCSGFVILSHMVTTGFPLSKYATYTENLKSWANYQKNSISKAEALKTPGALLGLGSGAGGAAHVGMSVGDGLTAAETGSQEGRFVGCSQFDYNSWEFYYLMPDWFVDYDPATNKPIPGLCNMIQAQEQGLCRYALPVSISGKQDLTPPDYLKNYTPAQVTMPNPPSAKKGDPFDLKVHGMVYEGAWKACNNLPGEMRTECERINKLSDEEKEQERLRRSNSITGGNEQMTNPAPCTTITPGRTFNPPAHNGIDYAGPEGHPIIAANDGTISAVWDYAQNSYGQGHHLEGTGYAVKHNNGETSYYMHMSKRCDFREGDKVRRGQVLGFIGNTGNSTGPHLHFGLLNAQGDYINPRGNGRLPTENRSDDFCAEYVKSECDTEITNVPVNISGPTLCVDKPCSVRYDEADTVAQCAYPTNEGGCGTLGNFSQSDRGGENGDCCFYITAPVTPMNHLKIRPGFDKEVPVPGIDNPNIFIDGAWRGQRTRDAYRAATADKDAYWGEGGQVDVSADSNGNQGAPEGYSFHEWFRNHRPFIRWWDTGAESGSIMQETAEPDAPWGMYDALVGVGIEKENCGYGGWGTSADINPNTSWMELKLYQVRTLRWRQMRCIGRYETIFKPLTSEDFVHRLAGGDFTSKHARKGIVNWPLSWRGYASDTEEDMRFPAYLDKNQTDPLAEATMVGTGIDNAMPGDILVYDPEVVKDSRLPHVAYVIGAETVANKGTDDRGNGGLSEIRWRDGKGQGELPQFVVVEEYNFGKYPDACGNTNWLGNSQERRLFKGSLPASEREQAAANKVPAPYSCDNPDLSACMEPLWDKVKIYRPSLHVRR